MRPVTSLIRRLTLTLGSERKARRFVKQRIAAVNAELASFVSLSDGDDDEIVTTGRWERPHLVRVD